VGKLQYMAQAPSSDVARKRLIARSTAVLGVGFAGERLTQAGLAGVGLIVLGVGLAVSGRGR